MCVLTLSRLQLLQCRKWQLDYLSYPKLKQKIIQLFVQVSAFLLPNKCQSQSVHSNCNRAIIRHGKSNFLYTGVSQGSVLVHPFSLYITTHGLSAHIIIVFPNMITKTRSYVTEYSARLLIQAVVISVTLLQYTHPYSILAGIKPLQMVPQS